MNLATTNDHVTVEAWIKPLTNSTTYGVMTVIGKRYTPDAFTTIGYEMFVLNGVPGFQIMNLSGVATFVATNHLRDGSYHHVAATLDRSSTNGGKIYVDGTPVLTFNPTVLSGSLSNHAPVRIGVHPQPGFNGWYKGEIDEAAIYRRALSGAEITTLYAAGSAGKCKTDTDGDGLTDLQENFLGTTANDSDTDDDALTDGDEFFVHHTNPNDADTDDDGLSDGWEWNHFGDFAQSASGDFDNDGINNGLEYTNATDPNTIDFIMAVTNQFTSSSNVPLSITVLRGVPSSIAVMVDSTNFPSATWTAFSSNKTVNVGSAEGWHQAWVGARGRMQTSYQTWKRKRLKLDLTAPLLVITNQPSSSVSKPIVQVQGYSPEPLAIFSYDLTNALGLESNKLAVLLNRRFSTNTWEFTTNYFQCFDAPLRNGLNTLTLRAKDLAGNVTVTNVNFTLDYSSKTNPPTINPSWPQNYTRISGNTFTARGWVDDPTAQVVAKIVADTGVTNIVSGRVGRDGDFWIDNVPLATGTNLLVLTATDVVSNSVATNFSVIKSALTLTIASAALEESASGGISDTNYTVWVNGVRATNQADSTWVAASPHLNLGHSVVQVRAIPNTDNGGNGSGSSAAEDQGNPNSNQAIDAETELVWPPGQIYANLLQQGFDYVWWETNGEPQDLWHYEINWEENAGGSDFEQWGVWPITTNIAHQVWEPGRWPDADSIEEVAWYSQGWFWTNSINGWPQPSRYRFGELEYDAYARLLTAHYREEMELTMVTSGNPGSAGVQLYGVEASGIAIGPPGPPDYGHYETSSALPPEQINICNFGNPAPNGWVFAVHPTRTLLGITPHVNGAGYYDVTLNPQEFQPGIFYGGQDVTDSTSAAVVGQKIELKCYYPGTLPTNFPPITKWEWTIPGYAVSNYTVTANSGTLYEDFSTSKSNVVFHWVDGGTNREVQCKITVKGQDITVKTRFNVVRPLPTFYAQIRDEVRVATDNHYNKVDLEGDVRILNPGTHIQFGIGSSRTNDGIVFGYTNAPLVTNSNITYGQYFLVQIVEHWRQRYNLVSGTNCTGYQAEGGPGLDGGYPSLGIATNLTHYEKWSDSPAGTLSIAKWLTHTNSFNSYLMFRPAPQDSTTIAVPMYEVQWSWRGTATNTPPWSKVSGAADCGQPTLTLQFPTWSYVILGFDTSPENCTTNSCFGEE